MDDAEEWMVWYYLCMSVKRGMYRGERDVRERSGKTTATLLVTAFFLIASAWFVLQSGFFDANEIQIDGLRSLERGDVDREVADALNEQSTHRPWNPTNILLLDKKRLEDRLQERLFAEVVTVDKTYPNILRLKIEERQRSVVLVTNDQYLLVDTSGVVTGYAEGDVLSSAMDHISARTLLTADSLPVIQMPTDEPPAPGFQIADPSIIQTWIQNARILISRGADTYFMKIEKPEAHLARYIMPGKYELRIDISRPIDDQVGAYETYLRTVEDSTITEYIDVRVPGKIFVN